MTNDRPRFCQIDDSDTPNIAVDGFSRIAWSPNPGTPPWYTPICWLMSTRNTTDATAADVAMVDEKIVWNTLTPRSRRLAATARTVPSTSPIGTVKITNWTLCHSPSRNSGPVRTSRYCSHPT